MQVGNAPTCILRPLAAGCTAGPLHPVNVRLRQDVRRRDTDDDKNNSSVVPEELSEFPFAWQPFFERFAADLEPIAW